MAQAPYQDGLTIITPIKSGEVPALAETLRQINEDVEENPYIPFTQFKRIHFVRWVILEASADARGRPTPASLVFSSNFDEPTEEHLAELFELAADGLHRIYTHCEGYPASAECTEAAVVEYLRRHDVGYNTLYVGTRGLTVPQIRREAALRDAIQAFLDEKTRQDAFLEQEPAAIREAIQDFVRSQPGLQWALTPEPEPRRFWPRPSDFRVLVALLLLIGIPVVVGLFTSFGGGLLTFAILLSLLVLAAALAAFMLRRLERRDEEYPATSDYDHVSTLAAQEDYIAQNQMTSVTNIKPGWFRLTTLRVVLATIDAAGRYIYTDGKLGTIPSIHFGRWVIIDDGRRLLFFSNFDGSWENYLGDFIDKAASGLTAVWSNTYGFPRTRWLVRDGATDEQRFKAYARNSQTVTDVWYSAYKKLTVQNINDNAQIRAGLIGPQTREQTLAWLQTL